MAWFRRLVGMIGMCAFVAAAAPAAWWGAQLLPFPAENALHDTHLFHAVALSPIFANVVGGVASAAVVVGATTLWRRRTIVGAALLAACTGLLYRVATAPESATHAEAILILIGSFVLAAPVLVVVGSLAASFAALRAQQHTPDCH